MPTFTEDAIKQAFIKLLEERPYSRITVKDIVSECGVNRNTFYYHFQDIPTLLETIIREQCDEIIRQYPSPESMEECLMAAIAFARDNSRIIRHVYRSVDRSIIETYLWKLCEYVVTVYTTSVFREHTLSEQDREMVRRYYKCVCFGGVMEYLENGMEEKDIASLRRLCEVKQGEIHDMLVRMETTDRA